MEHTSSAVEPGTEHRNQGNLPSQRYPDAWRYNIEAALQNKQKKSPTQLTPQKDPIFQVDM